MVAPAPHACPARGQARLAGVTPGPSRKRSLSLPLRMLSSYSQIPGKPVLKFLVKPRLSLASPSALRSLFFGVGLHSSFLYTYFFYPRRGQSHFLQALRDQNHFLQALRD